MQYNKYRSILILAILLLFGYSSTFADQLSWLTKEQADKAYKFLKLQTGKNLLSFCGCCEKDPKEYFVLLNVAIISTDQPNFFQIKIDGRKKGEAKSFSETFDLAYLWIQKGTQSACLGKELEFECDPCKEQFIWEDSPDAPQSSQIPMIVTANKVDSTLRINDIVRTAGIWISDRSSEERKINERKFDSLHTDKKVYEVVEKKYNRYENMESFAVIDPNKGSLWAGALIQGKDLQQGQLTPLGKFARAPIGVTVSGVGSRVVSNPSFANTSEAIKDILTKEKNPNSGQIYMHVIGQRSMSQTRCDIGAKIGFLPFSFEGKFSRSQDNDHNSIYLVFKQIYYTITAEDPSSPEDLFRKDVNLNELQQKIYPSNPLCYVSSVSFGRLIIAKFTSKSSIEDLQIAAKASLGKSSMFNASGSYQANNVLQNSSCEILVIGGSAQNSANAVSQMSFDALMDLVKADAKPSIDAQGEPISYTVRFVSDNSIAKIGQAGEYSVFEKKIKKKYFNVTFGDIKLLLLCNVTFTPFIYYSLSVIGSEGELLWSLPNNQGGKKRAGDIISIAKTAYRVEILDSPSQNITVQIQVYVQKIFGAGVEMGTNGERHFYPWITANGEWRKVIIGSNDCAATCSYNITPIE